MLRVVMGTLCERNGWTGFRSVVYKANKADSFVSDARAPDEGWSTYLGTMTGICNDTGKMNFGEDFEDTDEIDQGMLGDICLL